MYKFTSLALLSHTVLWHSNFPHLHLCNYLSFILYMYMYMYMYTYTLYDVYISDNYTHNEGYQREMSVICSSVSNSTIHFVRWSIPYAFPYSQFPFYTDYAAASHNLWYYYRYILVLYRESRQASCDGRSSGRHQYIHVKISLTVSNARPTKSFFRVLLAVMTSLSDRIQGNSFVAEFF